MVAGSYHGFNIYNLDNQGHAKLVSSVICPGGQGDVSIVGNLLIMSVEQNRGRIDCGLQGAGTEPNPERFRGIRIFDISDLKDLNKLVQSKHVVGHIHIQLSVVPMKMASLLFITQELQALEIKKSLKAALKPSRVTIVPPSFESMS